jgi:hypothetical protein
MRGMDQNGAFERVIDKYRSVEEARERERISSLIGSICD